MGEEFLPMFGKQNSDENKEDLGSLNDNISAQYGSIDIKDLNQNEDDNSPSSKPEKEHLQRFLILKDRRQMLRKTGSSFYEDAKNFAEGSIPQSILIGLVVGIVCGISAWIYYTILNSSLKILWKTLPQTLLIDKGVNELFYPLWIPTIGVSMAILVGVSVIILGDPGDMDYTVKNVHEKGYLEMSHVMPMVLTSLFSITGGYSIGPEAPLVAICAALGGFVSRHIFKRTNKNIIRKHTLMGMSGALSAFFGTCLGGTLFALEINSRFGVEYFEHMIESIFCGQICLTVFRTLGGLSNGPIWKFNVTPMTESYPHDVYLGVLLGLLGAGLATMFAFFHWKVVDIFKKFGLMEENKVVFRALVGCIFVVTIGLFVPHTMFWGKFISVVFFFIKAF